MPNSKMLSGKVLGFSIAAAALVSAFAVSPLMFVNATDAQTSAAATTRPRVDEQVFLNNFKLEIDGVLETSFKEVNGIGLEIEVIEIQQGADPETPPIKLPGKTTYSNIILKRGVTKSTKFFEWINSAVQGEPQRMSGKISALSTNGSPVAEWTFEKGWPCRYEGPKFDTSKSELAMETLEICHEGLKLGS